MIYSTFIFPIRQRIFWRKVKSRSAEWDKLIAKSDPVHISTLDNINYILYKNDVLSKYIYAGRFEWEEQEWIKSFLKPGMVFYDVGANIGFYTFIAAKAVGSKGKVYALEPALKTFNQLKDNIKVNSDLANHITAVQIAASNKNEEQEIYVSTGDLAAWNSLAKPDGDSDFTPEKIQSKKLSELVKENNWDAPDFIKIDVEGWEAFVIEGAKAIIETYKPVMLIEFTKEHLARTGSTYSSLKNQLTELGYDLFEYNPRKKSINIITSWDFDHKNVIAINKNGSPS